MKKEDVARAVSAAARMLQGEDPEVIAADSGFTVAEVFRWRALLETRLRKEERKEALAATREPMIEDRVRCYLTAQGYSVPVRHGPTGPDILAAKDGQTLL